jgi:hypothetical protein
MTLARLVILGFRRRIHEMSGQSRSRSDRCRISGVLSTNETGWGERPMASDIFDLSQTLS